MQQQQIQASIVNGSSRTSLISQVQPRTSSSSTFVMSQPSEKEQSIIDPNQFQNLFDQMQSNHDFLEKMQGILAMYPLNTESSEDNSSMNLQKTLTLNRMSSLNEELMKSQTVGMSGQFNAQNPMMPNNMQLQSTDNFHPTTKETMQYTPAPNNKHIMHTPISYQVDSQAKNLFQDQFLPSDQKNYLENANENFQQENDFNLQTPISSQPQGNEMFQNQMMNGFDPSQISPEYFSMFNQFYQIMMQVQSATQIDISNDPNFLQNIMVQYFTFMMQNGGMNNMQGFEGGPISPKNMRNYNNLPLAAIPESKDSIMEENSGWGTVKTNKLGLLMSANSALAKDSCNCCQNCQEMKKKGVYQQCSNFNIGGYQAFQNNSQINQDTFIQKSDISSACNSQILNNPFGLGMSPSPHHLQQPIDIQQKYATASSQVNQNLNQMFHINNIQQQNYSLEPSFNIQSHYQSRKESCQSGAEDLQHLNNLEGYVHNQNVNFNQPQQNMINMNHQIINQNEFSPVTQNQPQQDQVMLSPKQIQQNKLIEYMIDNNDFSNYKQRRQVIKGDRMSRTLSRSNSKNTTMQYWQHQHKLSIQSSHMNNQYNNTQRFSNQFQNQNAITYQLQNYQSNDDYNQHPQQFLSDFKPTKNDNYEHQGLLQAEDQRALMFFSPQVTNKQQCYVYKSTLEDVVSDEDLNEQQNPTQNQGDYIQYDQAFSPQTQRIVKEETGKTQRRKRTQEKIKEIRRLNEIQRGKDLVKKSLTRKNLHQQPSQKQVFEIKDLKQSQQRKNAHYRKQSQNVVSNKENNKLIQSNYQNNYEMSQQHIMLSPNSDPLMISIEQVPQQKDINTFKSLNSVANGRFSQSRQVQNFDQIDSTSPQITNLKLKLDQAKISAVITPFENMGQGNQQSKPSLNLNQLLAQEENRKPGQEIHIIKRPVQTEEFKKIQERLNKYYQDKRKEEVQVKPEMGKIQQQNQVNQNYNNQQNDSDAMSMTKTLSSFKSLMMKTMSQMSIHQENNIAQQFNQGNDQRQRMNSRLQGGAHHQNQSVNVSSIQDDYSVGVDYSENLTKIISPKNLYNGSLANIKQRNNNVQTQQPSEKNEQGLNNNQQLNMLSNSKKQLLLPNSLFFKQKGNPNQQQPFSEDTLSLKYNSRPPSLCFCGKNNCLCGQDSKKDLLCHFQNFLQEMDKHPQLNQGLGLYKESIFQSPIENVRQSASTNDFLLTNFQFLNAGRSSSQNSRLSRPKGLHGNRQSSVSATTNNNLGQPKMKRFSSGTTLTNLPLKKINQYMNHCQSTQVFTHLKKISIDSENQIKDIVVNQIKDFQQLSDGISSSPSKITMITQDQLEKLDTNKEEEIRLLNIENDIMHKAFIQKSHRLNLQDSQRNELLQRIQLYKQNQQANTKNNSGVSSTMHEEGAYSHGGVGSTQNTSHVTAMGYNSNYNSGNHSSLNQQQIQLQQQHLRRQSDVNNNYQNSLNVNQNVSNVTSLEERRKAEKYRKQMDLVGQNQNERENMNKQNYGYM